MVEQLRMPPGNILPDGIRFFYGGIRAIASECLVGHCRGTLGKILFVFRDFWLPD